MNHEEMNTCEACTEAKVKMKDLTRRIQTVAKVILPRIISARPNDLFSLDISTINASEGKRTVTKLNSRLIIN